MKAITRRDLPDEPIIGLHYVGPNAGEVMQGFGVAMKAGLTKSEFVGLVKWLTFAFRNS